jgi:hypothetical protein
MALSRNHCCRGKGVIISKSEGVCVALFIHNAMRMRRIIVSSVACLAVPRFSAYLKKAQFSKKNY